MEVHKVYLDSQYKGCVRKKEYVGFVHQKKRCMTASSDCIRLGSPLLPDVQCRTFPNRDRASGVRMYSREREREILHVVEERARGMSRSLA